MKRWKDSRNIGCTCEKEECECPCRCRSCRRIAEGYVPAFSIDTAGYEWTCVGVIAVFALPILSVLVIAWSL